MDETSYQTLPCQKSKNRLTKSVQKHLRTKYQNSFDFFQVKNISRIIFQQKQARISMQYKDMLDYIEDTEYLKKYYRLKSSNGKNEVKDRMNLLRNFYQSSDLLKWEYPMMTINNLQELFQKRHKKIIKLDMSSSEEQEFKDDDSQNSEIFQKKFTEEDQYLIDMNWSDILVGKFFQQNSIEEPKYKKPIIEYQDEDYSIFEDQKQLKRKDFLRRIGILDEKGEKSAFKWNDSGCEKEMSHLIVDFDDMDRNHIISEYKKLANKENISNNVHHSSSQKKNLPTITKITSFSQIKKPLSSSLLVSCDQQSPLTPFSKSPSNLSKQSMLIGSREQRFQEKQFMKKSNLIENKRQRSFNFPQAEIITENQGEQSPCDKQSKRLFQYFTPGHPRGNEVTEFRQIGQTVDSRYMHPKIKQSQILSRRSSQFQKSSSNQKQKERKQIQMLKQQPFQLLSSLKAFDCSKKSESQYQKTFKSLSKVKSFHSLQTMKPQQDNIIHLHHR